MSLPALSPRAFEPPDERGTKGGDSRNRRIPVAREVRPREIASGMAVSRKFAQPRRHSLQDHYDARTKSLRIHRCYKIKALTV